MGKTDKKKDKKGKTPVIPSLPDVHGDDDDMELSDEDLEFVKQQAGRLGFLKKLDRAAIDNYLTQPRPAKVKVDRAHRKGDSEDESEDEMMGSEDEDGPMVTDDEEDEEDLEDEDLDDEGLEDDDSDDDNEFDLAASARAAKAAGGERETKPAPPRAKPKPAPAQDAGAGSDSDSDGGNEAERAYERRARSMFRDEQKEEAAPLPVKSIGGQVVYDAKGQATSMYDLSLSQLRVKGVRVEEDKKFNRELEKRAREAEEKDAHQAKKRKVEAEAEGEGGEDGEGEEARGEGEAGPSQAPRSAQDKRLDSVRGLLNKELRRERLLEEIALSCGKLLESPEDNFPELKGLLQLCEDDDPSVSRRCQLSVAQVFRNICPGYKIRQLSEEEQESKVSKEVKRLRNFEMGLLGHYQAYLKLLLARVKTGVKKYATENNKDPTKVKLRVESDRRVAAQCMCVLLPSLYNFNYRSDLLTNVVQLMTHKDDTIRSQAFGTLKEMILADQDMDVAVETVQLIGDLVRQSFKPLARLFDKVARNKSADDLGAWHRDQGLQARIRKIMQRSIPPEVIAVLDFLPFTDLPAADPDQEDEGGDKKAKKKKEQKMKAAKAKAWGKKEAKELERDLQEAQAVLTPEERRRRQSKALEHVFEVYFRVIKGCVAAAPREAPQDLKDKVAPSLPGCLEEASPGAAEAAKQAARGQPIPASSPLPTWMLRLLPPTLRGLANFSQYMGLEYFQDLIALLLRMVHMPGLSCADQVQTLLTLADILQRQMDALRVDRQQLYDELFAIVARAPLEPLEEAWEERLPEDEDEDPEIAAAGARRKGSRASSSSEPPPSHLYATGLAPSLTRLLNALLGTSKTADLTRLAGALKAMLGASLHARPSLAMGVLGTAYMLLKRNGRLRGMLEGEGVEGGGPPSILRHFDPSLCTQASALWELALLQRHVHPHVASQARYLANLHPSTGAIPAGVAVQLPYPTLGPGELVAQYEKVEEEGKFNPGPRQPAAEASSSSRKGWDKASGTGPAPRDPRIRRALEAADGGADGAVEAALKEHFQSIRRVERNYQLRRKLALLQRRTKLMAEHLAAKKTAGGTKGGATATKPAPVTTTAAAAGPVANGKGPRDGRGGKAAGGEPKSARTPVTGPADGKLTKARGRDNSKGGTGSGERERHKGRPGKGKGKS